MDTNVKYIEIPFGAYDSELCGYEYTIPDGYEAEIKDGKVIVRKVESEDERIRKSIIAIISNYVDNSNTFKPKMIAWLEKQGEQKRLDFPYVTGWRENRLDNKPQIKHSVLMLTTHGVAEGEWLGEEWCQYRWSCKVKDADVLYWLHLSDLEYLEKENFEQKPIVPKFKVGDWITIKE